MNAERARQKVKVFITVDTEVWPNVQNWPQKPLASDYNPGRELDCYFWGGEVEPRLGVPFQLKTLAQHKLKATYFVDPLFSFRLGLGQLKSVIDVIGSAGQEVGLHMHPEWLNDCKGEGLPAFAGPFMHRYSLADQATLIRAALQRLRDAGAENIDSFRAGSWGANVDTLRALSQSGIRFDSSLNPCFSVSFPDLSERSRLQPTVIEGVWEVPVTYFTDRPKHRRPLHVCACSLAEFKHVLEQAHSAGWPAVVIVTHSFEFVRVERLEHPRKSVVPRRLLGKRFVALCNYLAANRDRFETAHFCDLPSDSFEESFSLNPIHSGMGRTLGRYVSQALSLAY